MYVQQEKYLPHTMEEIEKIITETIKPDMFAYIWHDNDRYTQAEYNKYLSENGQEPEWGVGQLKEKHLHIFMHWSESPYFNTVVKDFGDAPERFKKWDERFENGFAYLVHKTKDAIKDGKQPYNPADVIANFDYKSFIERYEKKGFFNIDNYLDAYEKHELTAKDLENIISENRDFITIQQKIHLIGKGFIRQFEIDKFFTPNEYVKNATRINKAFEYHYNAFLRDSRRNILVFVLQGDSRSGKTSFAKEYCEKTDLTYSQSGSGLNPWEAYKGEDCFIIDDLRDSVFKPFELLKMIDPYHSSMNKARYFDRIFLGKIIFITTNKPIHEWYQGVDEETRNAFFNRINCIYQFKEEKNYSTYYPIEFIDNKFVHYRDLKRIYIPLGEEGELLRRVYEVEKYDKFPEEVFDHNLVNENLFDNTLEKIARDSGKNRYIIPKNKEAVEKLNDGIFYAKKVPWNEELENNNSDDELTNIF